MPDFDWYFSNHDLARFPTVEAAGFKAIKGTKLRSNYWNDDWLPKIIEDLKANGRASVVMQNVPKNIKGSSNLFCINEAVFIIDDGQLHVEMDYRALNAMGPFLADLWLFNTLFNDIADRVDLPLAGVMVNSASAFAGPHTSWRIFWMAGLTPMERVELWMQLMDSAKANYSKKCIALLREHGLAETEPTGPWRQHKRMYRAVSKLPPECIKVLKDYVEARSKT